VVLVWVLCVGGFWGGGEKAPGGEEIATRCPVLSDVLLPRRIERAKFPQKGKTIGADFGARSRNGGAEPGLKQCIQLDRDHGNVSQVKSG